MFRDDDQFPMSSRLSFPENEEVTEDPPLNETRQYANDDFDDVFGSEPPSPTFSHSDPVAEDRQHGGGNVEYSDIPRIKEKHETEGYRDGVTKGKAETVQAGFDEGYGLGAVLGLKAGNILGMLEGIYNALRCVEGDSLKEERVRMEGLYTAAQGELDTRGIFGREWFGEDGIWKFDVPGEAEGKEVVFDDIAAAHPLVQRWEKVLQEEIERWGLNLHVMDEDEHAEDVEIDTKAEPEHVHHHTEEPSKSRPKPSIEKAPTPDGPRTPTPKVMGVSKADLNW